jgi:Arc/MetJ-type ribon-helix-helix transcriptional regulator
MEVVMSTLYRAQLLLESDQLDALAEIAEKEGRSISELVREIVRRHLGERAREAQMSAALQAMERLTEIRAGLREEHGIYQGDPLSEVRAERAEDIERVWQCEA